MIMVHGICDERFQPVKAAFELNFASRGEIGASVALTHKGEFVVDLWGGHLTPDRQAEWSRDTIANVWSCTKTMSALALMMLIDGGEVDPCATVVRYWPEFAARGKASVEVRHVMAHMAGLSGMDTPVSSDAMYDWEWMTGELAAQSPWWEPGSVSGYHALTQGFLIGEIVRRVTGQTIGKFFEQEVARPLDADFHIGNSHLHAARTSPLHLQADVKLQSNSEETIAARTFANPTVSIAETATEAWRKAEIPAANGHGNARSIVKIQTAVANGGQAFGRRLLSEAGVRRIFEVQSDGTDLVLGIPIMFGLGYGLASRSSDPGANREICYWGGYGGSVVHVDVEANLCLSYVMNRLEPGLVGDKRGASLVRAAYRSLSQ